MINFRNRRDLASKMPKHGTVAEIGVQTGDFSQVILGESAPKHLFLIDCWQIQAAPIYNDPANVSQKIQDRNYKLVFERFNQHRNVHLLRMYSNEAAKLFAAETFDWIYIDANHMKQEVLSDMEVWWPILKNGGFMCGHDYLEGDIQKQYSSFIQTKEAVDEFCEIYKVQIYGITTEPNKSWCIKKIGGGLSEPFQDNWCLALRRK